METLFEDTFKKLLPILCLKLNLIRCPKICQDYIAYGNRGCVER